MATLWHPAPTPSPAGWRPVPLPEAGSFALASAEVQRFSRPGFAAGVKSTWVAIGGGLRINGEPLSLGLRVLKNRDSLTTPDGAHFFYTDEEPARIEAFPGLAGGKPGTCARCRTPIAPGFPAVRCPGCGAWSHQTDSLPCWTYEGTVACPLCAHPNLLDAYTWSPDEAGW
jgi:Zn finger protein HypA/HybF involved in hydrogenase expression